MRFSAARSFSLLAVMMAPLLASPGVQAAGTFHVEIDNPSCSDSGPGTEAIPYCSIVKATQIQGGPGTTLLVKPGTYRERITVPASGTGIDSFVIRALGPGVVIDGADDFSEPALWSPVSGSVWRAASVDWNVRQVFLDGVRLAPSTAPATHLPSGSFRWISGEGLYVNIGGVNPGQRRMHVGRRTNNFRLNGVSWVSIEGFELTRADDIGIYMLGGCTSNTILRNKTTFARNNGIAANGCTDLLVASNIVTDNTDHGIYFYNGANDSTIRDNETVRNIRDGLGANGIKVESTERNLIQSNRTHHNQDSGIQINLSLDTISRYNVSYDNGDHGFDQLGSDGTRHLGDVAFRNYRDGFSVEGGNVDIEITNSIAVENGMTTANHNLYVDTTSTTGFYSAFNIFWNSIPMSPVSFNGVAYSDVSQFRSATGLATDTLDIDPMFVNPGAGDFRIKLGSPAIDSADSTSPAFTMTDHMGHPRVDDPHSPNAGSGPFPYADRGAFEFDMDCFGDGGTTCGTTEVGACSLGTTVCQDGVLTCSGVVGPSAEVCDGIDNDCDGTVDGAASGLTQIQVAGGVTTTIAWSGIVSATGYDVISGDLGTLRTTSGDFTAATTSCLASGSPDTTIEMSSAPTTGEGFFFLVRGVACGGAGTFDVPGPGQIGNRDTEIEASPVACN